MKRSPSPQIAVVGGGPAGLRAAEIAAERGAVVTVYDSQRSVGRKLLVAGKSGLNLTNAEEFESFLPRYQGPELPLPLVRTILGACDNEALRNWAEELGVETFAASSGKVFPRSMKAAPLLRAWIKRLRQRGVGFSMNHRLISLHSAPLAASFSTSQGERSVQADAFVLALGGGSWPQTGSTGEWIAVLERCGIAVSPLQPANCGWEIAWPSAVLEEAEGKPLKNIAASVHEHRVEGEMVLTSYGLEGGPLYHLGPPLRAMAQPAITLDLKPSLSESEIRARLQAVDSNYVREARRRLKLDPAACALLRHLPQLGPWNSPDVLAAAIKSLPLPLLRPRPLEEAISSAGGIAWRELDDSLMLRRLPGVFVAGEMIDWEAPTGGYLIQGCFALGGHAGAAAARWAGSR